jgi:predicted phage baseplate assembly protein
MALPIPILDDKLFPQLTEEARALIPPVSKEWTDFNASDPGITFLELFAWLAEIQQYRLNRTSRSGYDRMLALAGVTPAGLEPAEVEIDIHKGQPMLLPSNSVVTAVGKEDLPFATLHDTWLTKACLKEVVTHSGGRDIRQTAAESHDDGHFSAFGDSPAIGDSLKLGFDTWFENEIRVTFTLYEDDLPAPAPLSRSANGFAPSAAITWEYLADAGQWLPFTVSRDGTLGFRGAAL